MKKQMTQPGGGDVQSKKQSRTCIEPKSFDIILSETKLDMENLLISLTELEMMGIIKQIDGEKYTVV